MMSYQNLADLTKYHREDILRETEGERLLRLADQSRDTTLNVGLPAIRFAFVRSLLSLRRLSYRVVAGSQA